MNQKQFTFANEYLRHSNKIVAYTLAYGNSNNYTAVESAANRLLRTKEIADYIQQTRDSIRHQVEEEMKEKYKEELLTVYEKRLYIKKLLFGEIQVEIKYKGKNCTQCSHYMSPTIPMALNLLKEDSKLAGHYPDKRLQKNTPQQNMYCPAQDTMSRNVQEEDTYLEQSQNSPNTEYCNNPQSHNKTQQNEQVNTPHRNETQQQRGEDKGITHTEQSQNQTGQSHNKTQQLEQVNIPHRNEIPHQQEEDKGITHTEQSRCSQTKENHYKSLPMQVSESYHMVAQTAAKHAPNNN